MLLTTKQFSLYSVSAAFGTVVTYMFGGWTPLLEILLIAMAIDYVSGIAASLREGKGLNSEIGFWGLIKKSFMLLSVFIAHKLDLALGTDWIMIGAIYFWLANELVSLAENYGRLNLPLSDYLKPIIAILKNKGEKQKE